MMVKYSLLSCWFNLYFICIIYDEYTKQHRIRLQYKTIQMGFRRKSNELFESVSHYMFTPVIDTYFIKHGVNFLIAKDMVISDSWTIR